MQAEQQRSNDAGDEYSRYVGRTASVARPGLDPVNAPMIRHWCEAMGDRHPSYREGPGQVAPPAMLQAWTMAGLSVDLQRAGAYGELLTDLDAAGFTSVVATDCEQEYLRPLRPGDRVVSDAVVESVSPLKRTALGEGHFVTTRTEIKVAGEVAGTHRFRILKFRPREGGSKKSGEDRASRAPRGLRPRPVVNRDNACFWDGISEGRLLYQRCSDCRRARLPWLPGCPGCGSDRWTAEESSGRGTVYSRVVVHHPLPPAFPGPYSVALVELAEGVRLVSNVVGVPPEEVAIGTPVRVSYQRCDEELTLPLFVPVDAPQPLRLPITRTRIVAGAIASRDYQDVHHDAEAARAKGSPDIFMNILTTNGLVGRYATDWAGPGAELRRIAIRLGVPAYPGDELELTGRVTARHREGGSADGSADDSAAGREYAELAVTGTVSIGTHVSGTVTLALPEGGAGAEGTGVSA
ncbi:OB-fold domain-containing protein [Phaeacidiphilus oryzae]|uniref:OB-fold domain-containing protein n=1 Tax=Phaeacidiphilus oryzae TaxID=348818 RepID=UPI0007C8405A|nr:OB-fold domain-containing protein [Phaeacidiphilus oryzae]